MYFGSVRFFKNMILLVVIISILIPTYTSFRYKAKYETLLEETQLLPMSSRLIESYDYYNDYSQLKIEPEVPEYQNKYPDFYAPQELNATEKASKTVYFTFDDGPSARTLEVLDILAQEDVKATFFVVGSTNLPSKDIMKNIVEQGHTIAMHTYSHQYKKIYNSVDDYLDDMYQIFTLIKDTTGVTPTHFRFAGGSVNSYNHQVYQDIISEMLRRGFVPFDWNVASGDASNILLSTNDIVNNVLTGIAKTDRAIVLMHDSLSRTTTVQALPIIIQTLKEQGYSFDKLTPQTKPVLFAYS